jgi:hypothetical protein
LVVLVIVLAIIKDVIQPAETEDQAILAGEQ